MGWGVDGDVAAGAGWDVAGDVAGGWGVDGDVATTAGPFVPLDRPGCPETVRPCHARRDWV